MPILLLALLRQYMVVLLSLGTPEGIWSFLFSLLGLFFAMWNLKKRSDPVIFTVTGIFLPWWHLPTHAAHACLRCLSPEPTELIYGRILMINGLSQRRGYGRIRPSTSTLPAWKGDRVGPGTAFEIVAIVMLKPKIKGEGDSLSQ